MDIRRGNRTTLINEVESSKKEKIRKRKRARSLRKAALLRPKLVESDEDEPLHLHPVYRSPRVSAGPEDSHTFWWGLFIFFMTWIVFVIGMGSQIGVWTWALGNSTYVIEGTTLEEYSITLGVLSAGVMAWLWVVSAWTGLKHFRHSAPAAAA